MFLIDPVDRSSITVTLFSFDNVIVTARLEPINPAPPVITIF